MPPVAAKTARSDATPGRSAVPAPSAMSLVSEVPAFDLETHEGRLEAMRWITQAALAGVVTPDAARAATSTVRQAAQLASYAETGREASHKLTRKAGKAPADEPPASGNGAFERALEAAESARRAG